MHLPLGNCGDVICACACEQLHVVCVCKSVLVHTQILHVCERACVNFLCMRESLCERPRRPIEPVASESGGTQFPAWSLKRSFTKRPAKLWPLGVLRITGIPVIIRVNMAAALKKIEKQLRTTAVN